MKSRRQEERNRGYGPESGEDSHQGFDQDPDKAEKKVDRLKGDLESKEEVLKNLHNFA
jgi:hypothetical protein